jgi:methanogenic corrinoid protein MtbC1
MLAAVTIAPADPGRAFELALLSTDAVAARREFAATAEREGTFGAMETLVVPALQRIGAAWEAGDLALAQLYLAGRIAEEVVTANLPTVGSYTGGVPPIAIAVLEDHHVLGKRLVVSALRAAGYGVTDYGRGITVDDLVARCAAAHPRVLLVSTLMLPSALRVRDLAAGLAALDARPALVVGGAPFRLDPQLWREVGADAGGHSSTDAIGLVRRFLGGAA